MVNIKLDEIKGIAILESLGKLSEDDFQQVAAIIDPYIKKMGKLNGLILYSKEFPGWESFSGFLKHIKFIKEHHKNLARVAIVTDSKLVNAGEHIVKHFVSVEVEKFPFNDMQGAERWISALMPV